MLQSFALPWHLHTRLATSGIRGWTEREVIGKNNHFATGTQLCQFFHTGTRDRDGKKEKQGKGGVGGHLGSAGDWEGSQLSDFPSCSVDLHCARERALGLTSMLPGSRAGSTCPMNVLPHIASISQCLCKKWRYMDIFIPVRVCSRVLFLSDHW